MIASHATVSRLKHASKGSTRWSNRFIFFKGTVTWHILACFLAYMDASRPEYEPLLDFKFLWSSFDLRSHFQFYAFHGKPSQRFSESPRRFDNFVCSSVIFVCSLLVVLQECSGFFNKSLRSIYTLSHVSWRNTTPENIKLENLGQIVKPSRRLSESPRRFRLPKIERASLKCKNQKRFPFGRRCIRSGRQLP